MQKNMRARQSTNKRARETIRTQGDTILYGIGCKRALRVIRCKRTFTDERINSLNFE